MKRFPFAGHALDFLNSGCSCVSTRTGGRPNVTTSCLPFQRGFYAPFLLASAVARPPVPHDRSPAEIVSPPVPSVCELSIGLRGHTIEASFGYGDRPVQGMGTALDRQTLTRMMADALAHQSKARVLGRELAKRLHAVVLNALRETPTDRTMPLWRMPPPDEVQLSTGARRWRFLLNCARRLRASLSVYPLMRRRSDDSSR
jgi:hypothetical protein